MRNRGQSALNLTCLGGGEDMIKSTFQVAKVTRPLMSVGKITDAGMTVEFDRLQATVKNAQGKTVCSFVRNQGGLYVCKMRLKRPSPMPNFHRPS